MDDVGDRMTKAALHAAARWLGIGIAALPGLDIADRSGLLVSLTSPQTLELDLVLVPLLQIAFFSAIGWGASALLRRHRPSVRPWFFAGCGLPVLAYTLATGLRLAAVVALVALCFAFVQLRLARDATPTA